MFENIKKILERIKSNKNKLLETMDYAQISNLMEENGLMAEFQKQLNNLDDVARLMDNGTQIHGINHIVRTLFNVYAIATLENVSPRDLKVIAAAARLHDNARIADGEDQLHGYLSAINAREMLSHSDDYSKEEIDEICFIIEEHCLSRETNNMDLEELPESLRENYGYCLNILKDADKLDRVRIGDLDPSKLSTQSSKRLIAVAHDNYVTNRFSYKKKFEVYPYNEEEAKEILEDVRRINPNLEITLDEIKRDYSTFKAFKEQGKIEWIDCVGNDFSMQDFLKIANVVSPEDVKYLEENHLIGYSIIIEAVKAMGIINYMRLKSDNDLDEILCAKNFKDVNIRIPEEEHEFFKSYKQNDIRNVAYRQFFLLHYFYSRKNSKKCDALLQSNKDLYEYLRIENEKGYRWQDNVLIAPLVVEMTVIEAIEPELLLDIKEKFGIPLCIILTGIAELELYDNKELSLDELGKILLNYYRCNLNIQPRKDKEQAKKLLLDLPENVGDEYKTVIQNCIAGRFRRFGLDSFEQIKNYAQIIDGKILEEFDKTDDVDELRNMILETKVRNIERLKRDIYFYRKYTGNESNNRIASLFEKMLYTHDKDELQESYAELNSINPEFDLDITLQGVRDELTQISKQDVVQQMTNMGQRISTMERTIKDGQEVIDLTGTDFNLLISVIGATGSPYLVEYRNKLITMIRNYPSTLSRIRFAAGTTIGMKRLINKRYKFDPLKNKQRCVSSIDQDFLGHIKSAHKEDEEEQISEKLILAYFPQNQEDVYWMGNDDLMTEYDKDRSDPTRKRVPHKDNQDRICYLKLQDLNATTTGDDNEIIIDSNPGAVMCFDRVSNIARKTAEKLQVPILYIDSQRQFQIMEKRLNQYYSDVKARMIQEKQMTE